jgi:sulfonate transport system substrate-binding protein
MQINPISKVRRNVTGSRRPLTCGLLGGLAVTLLAVSGGAAQASPSPSPSLAGVTITFGDQLKAYQTILAATNALKGAPYTVNWANFIGGPPVIAAETSGSVDLGFMAETPTIFAEEAGDPVKVVSATLNANPKVSPYAIVVPTGSPIKSLSQLKGKSIAVQEGTVEQYFLIQELEKGHVAYNAVHIQNLTITNAATAVANNQVQAAVLSQPLTGSDQTQGKIRVIGTGVGTSQTIGYLTASSSALANPQKAAAIADFIVRFDKAEAQLRKNPLLAAQTYVKTYGVPLTVAKEAVASEESVGSPITPAIESYQQAEANTFLKLGLLTTPINVKKIFDLPFNKTVDKAAGIS